MHNINTSSVTSTVLSQQTAPMINFLQVQRSISLFSLKKKMGYIAADDLLSSNASKEIGVESCRLLSSSSVYVVVP